MSFNRICRQSTLVLVAFLCTACNIDITYKPQAPVAVSDSYSIEQNEYKLVNVLINDYDDNGDALTISRLDTTGFQGTATIVDNQINIGATTSFIGTTSLKYQISDGERLSEWAEVTVNIIDKPQVQSPVAVSDSYSIVRNEYKLVNVLINDHDDNGNTLTISRLDTTGFQGTATIVDNQINIGATTSFIGTTSLKYQISNGETLSEWAEVYVTIDEANVKLRAVSDVVSLLVGETIVVDVLANDKDPQAGGLKLENVTTDGATPVPGAVILNNVVSYTAEQQPGEKHFYYLMRDSAYSYQTGRLTITIKPENPPAPLLSGCTVAEGNNMTDCALPSGWTVVNQESFAGGQLNGDGSPTTWAGNATGYWGGVSQLESHTGLYGLNCETAGDDSYCNYKVESGAANEIYMSYWEFLGGDITAGVDFFLGRLRVNENGTSNSRDLRLDPNSPIGPYKTLINQYEIYSEGGGRTSIACYSHTADRMGGCTDGEGIVSGDDYWNMEADTWHQWEMRVKPGSCNGDTPIADGHFYVYLDGKLVMSVQNMNIFGCPSMAGDPSLTVEVGGYQSFQALLNEYGQCVPYGDASAVKTQSCSVFADCPAYQADGVTPCFAGIQTYDRALDDVIIMKR